MNQLKNRIHQFLTSLPKITLPMGTILYHGTNLNKISINDQDRLFMSLNQTESVRHAIRKNFEQKTGRPYLHTYLLKNKITVIDFTEFTRKINAQKQYKWDIINNIIDSHLDNFQMELSFFDLLKEHPELNGYFDGCDQCVVLLTHPREYLKYVDVQYIKSLKQNNCKIKIKHHNLKSVEYAYQFFDKYYHDLYINRLNPNPVQIIYDHPR
jgi:hypothetical protein